METYKVNICFDCQRACGGCSWSAIDKKTKRPKFEPVPGWTAEKVKYNAWQNKNSTKWIDTYYITACPLYLPDERDGVFYDGEVQFRCMPPTRRYGR